MGVGIVYCFEFGEIKKRYKKMKPYPTGIGYGIFSYTGKLSP
jgi:hypothetical protein